jgi:hypothetical protein
MDAYRRISRANDLTTLERIEADLVSAYGSLPRAAQMHMQLAEIRVSATLLGITSINRHDDDIIFRTRRPGDLEAHMKGVKGSLRVVGELESAGFTEVYFRPPKSYLEPDSLLSVLRSRLRGQAVSRSKVDIRRPTADSR